MVRYQKSSIGTGKKEQNRPLRGQRKRGASSAPTAREEKTATRKIRKREGTQSGRKENTYTRLPATSIFFPPKTRAACDLPLAPPVSSEGRKRNKGQLLQTNRPRPCSQKRVNSYDSPYGQEKHGISENHLQFNRDRYARESSWTTEGTVPSKGRQWGNRSRGRFPTRGHRSSVPTRKTKAQRGIGGILTRTTYSL